VLEELLRQLGLTVAAGVLAGGGLSDDGPAPRARKDVFKRMRDLVSPEIRAAVSKRLPHAMQERLSLRWMTSDVDWARTKAFLVSNANEGFVRVNLRGREPLGIVAPGAEYDELCEAIVRAVKGLVNPHNGRAAVRAAWRPPRVFSGACVDRLPDVVVNWDPAAKIATELFGDVSGLVKTARPGWELPPYYVGNHHPSAFVIARGPAIAPGTTLGDAHVLDLAPTLLAHFGLEPTAAMDGHVLAALGARASDRRCAG
jgi:predicted AlkP superfamily phosphohydrolase/phosphomutase